MSSRPPTSRRSPPASASRPGHYSVLPRRQRTGQAGPGRGWTHELVALTRRAQGATTTSVRSARVPPTVSACPVVKVAAYAGPGSRTSHRPRPADATTTSTRNPRRVARVDEALHLRPGFARIEAIKRDPVHSAVDAGSPCVVPLWDAAVRQGTNLEVRGHREGLALRARDHDGQILHRNRPQL